MYTKKEPPGDVQAIFRAITSTYEHIFTFSFIHFDSPNLLRNLPFPSALIRAEAPNYNLAPTSLAYAAVLKDLGRSIGAMALLAFFATNEKAGMISYRPKHGR